MAAVDIDAQVAAASSSRKRILFLRPFWLDGSLQVQNPKKDGLAAGIVPFYRFVQRDHVSLDQALRLYLRSRGELVAIGAPGEVVGASRVRVHDDTWKTYFVALAQSALALIMFPGLRPGTLYEIESIRTNPAVLAKTIFVLPPKDIETLAEVPTADAIVAALNKTGFRLPLDARPGEAILFNADGDVRLRLEFLRTGVLGYWLKKDDVTSAVDTIVHTR